MAAKANSTDDFLSDINGILVDDADTRFDLTSSEALQQLGLQSSIMKTTNSNFHDKATSNFRGSADDAQCQTPTWLTATGCDTALVRPEGDHVPSAHFQGRQRGLEISDLYFKPNRFLVATPYSNTDSDPMESSLDSSLEGSQTKEKRESFRSENTLVSHIETQSVHERTLSPEPGSNLSSRLIFNWISGLLWVSGQQLPWNPAKSPANICLPSRLDIGDHSSPLTFPRFIHISSRPALKATIQDIFQANRQRGDRFALVWALYRAFKRDFWIGGLCRGVADVLFVTVPYTLRYLIQYVMDSYEANMAHRVGPPMWHGIAYLAGIVTILAIQIPAHNHYMYLLGVIGGQSRAVLTSVIFDKSMRVMGRGRAAVEEKERPTSEDPA
ncbi:MAG: hypothetical protein Q9208_006649 [Pyrenodesmia sp. 3 TL-2023]